MVCFRPRQLCFCASIPQIDNKTRILLIQHRRERFHAFNTARIVHRALSQCNLITDHNDSMSQQFSDTPLAADVGLLFPGDGAKLLTEIDPSDYPSQLVIIDGTWNQAKTLFRALPRLAELPKFSLAPESPSRYRIRREPNEQAVSTLEATVAALSVLEPTTKGLDGLLKVFDLMIDDQVQVVEERTGGTNKLWRKRKRRTLVSNVPRCLNGDLSNVVVAYGESELGRPSKESKRSKKENPVPVYWVAQRLGNQGMGNLHLGNQSMEGNQPFDSGELFRCRIDSPSCSDEDFTQRLRLKPEELAESVSLSQFVDRWRSFLRPNDKVVVYHPNTGKLLRNAGAEFRPVVTLKAVKLEKGGGRGTLDDVIRSLGIETQPRGHSRAMERLACAVGLVHYLNDWCLSQVDES